VTKISIAVKMPKEFCTLFLRTLSEKSFDFYDCHAKGKIFIKFNIAFLLVTLGTILSNTVLRLSQNSPFHDFHRLLAPPLRVEVSENHPTLQCWGKDDFRQK